MADYIITDNNQTLPVGGPSDTSDNFEVTGDNNTVNAGAGDDSVGVQGDNNTLNGEAGNDLLAVFGNSNTLNGGPGDDMLMVVAGNDNALNGGDGNDTLIGSDGKDFLNGGAGDDLLNGNGGGDVYQFSFTLDKAAGEPQTFTFTDWLSEKYGKDFGDQLPDFQGGHDHHHGHHGRDDHHHGKHDEHGKHGHHHHQHYAHHDTHHHQHGHCQDHQPHQEGLSKSFFAVNYMEWLREVVVPDLEAKGLAHDENGNGKIDVSLNAKDPGGTPHIEGISDDQLAQIFGDRDEETARPRWPAEMVTIPLLTRSLSTPTTTCTRWNSTV